MVNLLDAQGSLKTLSNNSKIFECDKKSNVKLLAFPSGLHISCPNHHFQGFSPCKNEASFQNVS